MTPWTAEQKRAYAIKKRMERAGKNRHPGRDEPEAPLLEPVAGFEVHPANHPCGARDITYGTDRSQCRVCGRRWDRVVMGVDAMGKTYYQYVVTPLTKRRPTR